MAMEQPKKVTGGAYGMFLSAKRPEFAKECAGKPVTAVVKLASERFKALGESERAIWEAKYQEARAQYDKDMAAFEAAGGEKKAIKRKKGDDDAKGAKKQKKDPDAPKRPCGGAFGCWLAKHREALTKECAGKPITAVTKLAGERWKAMGDEEKKPFEAEYEIKKAEYDKAMAAYTPPAKAGEECSAEEPTPTKEVPKAATGKTSSPKVANRGKGKAAAAGPAEVVEPAIADQATKDGLLDSLKTLIARPDVKDSGKSQAEVLKVLKENNGLVHPSRRALLGA